MKNLLYLTFLCFLSINAFSQRVLTRGEVYDFEIGDEFHYEDHELSFDYPRSGTKIKVIDKYYSSNTDTVYYTFENQRVEQEDQWPRNYTWGNVYTTQQSLADTFAQLPIFDLDTIPTQNRTDSAGTYINFYSYTVGTFEPDVYGGAYGEGIGVVNELSASPSMWSISGHYLIYYKKQNKEWGTPWDDIVSVEEELELNEVSIYPNPCQTELNVKVSSPTEITIFSLLGKKMLSTNATMGTNIIDVSNLESGTYIISYSSSTDVKHQVFQKME